MELWLANLILILHFIYVLAVLIPIPLIWIGGSRRWNWVFNPWFRNIHLALILIVLLEGLIGMACPLTTWENTLREIAGERPYGQPFVVEWVERILYQDLELWMFTAVYFLIAVLIGFLYMKFPPRWPLRGLHEYRLQAT